MNEMLLDEATYKNVLHDTMCNKARIQKVNMEYFWRVSDISVSCTT